MQFNQVVGNKDLKHALIKIAKTNRVHHTQLFLGRAGGGTLAFVLAYAQYLLCENPIEGDSCGECNACKKMQKLIHPDVHLTFPTVTKKSGEKPISDDFISEFREFVLNQPFGDVNDWLNHIRAENKQGNITARECSEIMKKAKFSRLEGKYKINIIWMAEALAKEGNRLLKILEEPPENTIFLLIAEDEDRILNTILSRCQVNRLRRIEDTEIEEFLQQKGVEGDTAKSIAVLADGNLNLALNYAENQVGVSKIVDWFRIILSRQSQLVEFTEDLAKMSKENLKKMVLHGTHFCRESLLLQQDGLQGRLPKNEQSLAKYLSDNLDLEQISKLSELLNDAIYAIERNANVKLLLLSLSIEIQSIIKRVSVR